ncbi:prefoldin subunit alpha [Candidatus Woesearchaeota archaeon]|nr:prefoldin subunit alpha [Candidatus Woesearchaeota archaeon]
MPNEKEELQKNYLELQILTNQFQQIQDQLTLVSNQITELSNQIQHLNEFKEIKNKPKIFTQVLPGIFIKAELEDTEKLLVNVGANVLVQKSPYETEQLIKQKIDELKEAEDALKQELIKIYNHIENIQSLLE